MSKSRQRLVDAATRLYANAGTAASMRDLALVLNIKAPSIYSHFPSKDALIEACIAPYTDAVAALCNPEATMDLGGFLGAYANVLTAHRYEAHIVHTDPTIRFGAAASRIEALLCEKLYDFGVPPRLCQPLLAFVRQPWLGGGMVDPEQIQVIVRFAADAFSPLVPA